MTPLLDTLLSLLEEWRGSFAQFRTFQRCLLLALCQILTPGGRTISRLIACAGRHLEDWSAHYRLFSRSQWQACALFEPVVARCVKFSEKLPFIALAGDFTHLKKSGRHIAHVRCMRDPLSPPFHANLIYGLRYFQISCLLPLYRESQSPQPPRSLPVCFEEVPVPAKPGRKASEEEKREHRREQKKQPASRKALEFIEGMRRRMDAAGAAAKKLVVALDGSFCNRTFFRATPDRIEWVCRCRKDAKLCLRAKPGQRRFYDAKRFTPGQVLRDGRRRWKTARLFYAGAWRELRYKECAEVYWQSAAGRRPLRLLVLEPTAYRLRRGAPLNYRQPAFLLSTDLKSPAEALLQTYLDRWQIEVNHREEKTTFGVGDAQVRHEQSVARQPAFAVAVYALLLLAALQTHGAERTEAYQPLPRWRRKAQRPSCQDIVDQLRREMDSAPQKLVGFRLNSPPIQNATLHAAA